MHETAGVRQMRSRRTSPQRMLSGDTEVRTMQRIARAGLATARDSVQL